MTDAAHLAAVCRFVPRLSSRRRRGCVEVRVVDEESVSTGAAASVVGGPRAVVVRAQLHDARTAAAVDVAGRRRRRRRRRVLQQSDERRRGRVVGEARRRRQLVDQKQQLEVGRRRSADLEAGQRRRRRRAEYVRHRRAMIAADVERRHSVVIATAAEAAGPAVVRVVDGRATTATSVPLVVRAAKLPVIIRRVFAVRLPLRVRNCVVLVANIVVTKRAWLLFFYTRASQTAPINLHRCYIHYYNNVQLITYRSSYRASCKLKLYMSYCICTSNLTV